MHIESPKRDISYFKPLYIKNNSCQSDFSYIKNGNGVPLNLQEANRIWLMSASL